MEAEVQVKDGHGVPWGGVASLATHQPLEEGKEGMDLDSMLSLGKGELLEGSPGGEGLAVWLLSGALGCP